MTVTVVATVNETSFAVAYADATALVLDAIAAGGSARRSLLTRAQDRLDAAMRHASKDSRAEYTLVTQLVQTIKLWERDGTDWA